MNDRDVMELMNMVEGHNIVLKKAGVFNRAVYPVRCLLRRLWHLIRPKSWAKSHGLRKGDIMHFEGVSGINDGDYEITGVSDPK